MNTQQKLAKIDVIIQGLERSGEVELLECWKHHRADVAASEESRYSAFRLGQVVQLAGKYKARVVDVASNGVWIIRSATEGEFVRTGKDQIRERVSIAALASYKAFKN